LAIVAAEIGFGISEDGGMTAVGAEPLFFFFELVLFCFGALCSVLVFIALLSAGCFCLYCFCWLLDWLR